MTKQTNSIISKLDELIEKSGKVDTIITVTAGALSSTASDDIESALTMAMEDNSFVIDGLMELSHQIRNHHGGGISPQKIKKLSSDTSEIYHLLTFIINGMRSDPECEVKYEEALSGLSILVGKANSELFELGEGDD